MSAFKEVINSDPIELVFVCELSARLLILSAKTNVAW